MRIYLCKVSDKCLISFQDHFTDLMHTDPMSELYQRKVSKARTAIENASTARSIVRHLKQYDGMKHQLAHLPSDPGTSRKPSILRPPHPSNLFCTNPNLSRPVCLSTVTLLLLLLTPSDTLIQISLCRRAWLVGAVAVVFPKRRSRRASRFSRLSRWCES